MKTLLGISLAVLGMAFVVGEIYAPPHVSASAISAVTYDLEEELVALVGLALVVGGIYIPQQQSVSTEARITNDL